MKYYKFLTDDNKGKYSGFNFTGYLPRGNKPGKWLPKVKGDLVSCKKGYHACGPDNVTEWIDVQMFEVEYSDEPVVHGDKVYGRSIRFVRKMEGWNEKTARLFACDCADRALHLVRNPDKRSVNAVAVSRRYANGAATKKELDAARDACAAARDACAAEKAVQSRLLMEYAEGEK